MVMHGHQKLRSRFLPERSFLYFVYPQPENKIIEFHLPMLENIEIGESQKPNYVTYDLIGRSGNLFAYTGSKSREFLLKFNFTLPNIHDYLNSITMNQIFRQKTKYFYQLNEADRFSPTSQRIDLPRRGIFFKKSQEFKSLVESDGKSVIDSLTVDKDNASLLSRILGSQQSNIDNLSEAEQLKRIYSTDAASNAALATSVDTLILWVNILRTSVVNNSKFTNLVPPTIYLNHGTMYNNIPCLVTNVSISINTPIGYELYSMTPRQVSITMNLVENRVGNFGEFVPFKQTESENLAGWEAVITHGTIDPHNIDPYS